MGSKPILRLLFPILLYAAAGNAMAATKPSAAKPDPKLDPATVVRIQLDALAHVDEPVRDAGIAVVFGFSTPENQAQTGPFRRFAELVRTAYPEMLNHRAAILATTVVRGDHALQGVDLIDRAGSVHHYLYILSRQRQPPYKDCWLTDRVLNNLSAPKRLET